MRSSATLALPHLGGWGGTTALHSSTTFKRYSCTHLVGGMQHYAQAPLALNCVEMGPTALHSGGVGSRALHMLGRGTALCTQAPRLHFRILGGGVGRQHYTQALHSSATLALTCILQGGVGVYSAIVQYVNKVQPQAGQASLGRAGVLTVDRNQKFRSSPLLSQVLPSKM